MQDILSAYVLTEEIQSAYFTDFWCGPEEYQDEVAEWIRQTGPGGALDSAKDGITRVWAYFSPHHQSYVGFGSLAPDIWTFGDERIEQPLLTIPMLGLHLDYHGLPDDPPRYSTQMLTHLINEARKSTFPILGLAVHPENKPAKKAYSRIGFASLTHYPDGYDRMFLALRK